MNAKDELEIGRIYREHGVRGFCKAHIYSASDENLELGGSYVLRGEGRELKVRLMEISNIGRYFLLRFDGVASREEMIGWRKAGIWREKRLLKGLADGEMYDFEWEGFEAVAVSGGVVGKIIGIAYTPLRQWRVAGKSGREFLVPCEKSWIKKLDRKGKRIVLEMPEGIAEG